MKYRRKRLKERTRTNAARGGEPRLRIRLSRPLSIKNSQATVRCEMTQFTIYAKGNPEEERSILPRPYRVYINEPRINRVKPVGEREPMNQTRLGLFVGRPETRLIPLLFLLLRSSIPRGPRNLDPVQLASVKAA